MNIPRLITGLLLLRGAVGSILPGFSAEPVTFTNAADIHRLTRQASSQNHPVVLRGVVTYSDALWNVLFIQDDSAGVFISLAGANYPTNAELVEVTGHTEAGSVLPVVAGAAWRHLGVATMPEPRRIVQPERFGSEIDSGWSEMEGVVRKIELNSEKNHFEMEVVNEGWRARLFVPAPDDRYPKEFNDLIDGKIRAVGVAGIDESDPGIPIGLKCFVPNWKLVNLLEKPSSDPYLQPFTPLSKVLAYSLTNLPVHRIHIRGVATYVNDPNEIVLQEGNSAVRVQVPDSMSFKLGDSFDVVGFVSPAHFSLKVEGTQIRPATTLQRIEPVPIGPATVLWGNYDGRLVRLTGVLQSHQATATNAVMTLLQDGVLFGASLNSVTPSEWSKFNKGDRVQITGVCAVQGAGRGAPQSFQVLLRSPEDAVYVSSARMFSAQQVLLVIGSGLAGLGIVLLWSFILKRRVREQTAELARSLSLLHATIESTADGILVVDRNGRVRSYNTTFARMWGLSNDILESKDEQKLMDFAEANLKDNEGFVSRVREVYAKPEEDSFDTLEFKDGRIFERVSQPQRLEGKCIGRVWCFREVTARKRAEAQLSAVHHELLETSRRVGMAEVATAVLHNVGNVLNSVNVSATLVTDRLRRSRATNLLQAANLIESRMDDLETFLSQDPKGVKLRSYLKELSTNLVRENDEIRLEVESLRRNIEHIKTIVAMQQSYAQVSGTLEKLDPRELMENAVQINGAAYERDQIQVTRDYKAVPQVLVDRHKVLQILINLLSNARHALEQTATDRRFVNLSIFPISSERVCLRVEDNGAGIEPQNLSRIFSQGFTTRKDGHGFGLHSGANAAKEMNGSLAVHSEGPAKGASFTLELPITKESNPRQ